MTGKKVYFLPTQRLNTFFKGKAVMRVAFVPPNRIVIQEWLSRDVVPYARSNVLFSRIQACLKRYTSNNRAASWNKGASTNKTFGTTNLNFYVKFDLEDDLIRDRVLKEIRTIIVAWKLGA